MLHQKHRGFIALFSILVLGALLLIVVIGASTRSIEETQTSIANDASSKALAMANLCAELALLKIQSTLNPISEDISVDGNTCTIVAYLGSGNTNRIIQTQSKVLVYTRKVVVSVSQVSPVLTVTSWKEVADF